MSLTFHNPNKLIIYQVGIDTRAPLPCSHCEKQLYSLSVSLLLFPFSSFHPRPLLPPLSLVSHPLTSLSPFSPSISPVSVSSCLCSLVVSPPLPPPYRFTCYPFFLLLSLSLPFFPSIFLSHDISPQPHPAPPPIHFPSLHIFLFISSSPSPPCPLHPACLRLFLH